MTFDSFDCQFAPHHLLSYRCSVEVVVVHAVHRFSFMLLQVEKGLHAAANSRNFPLFHVLTCHSRGCNLHLTDLVRPVPASLSILQPLNFFDPRVTVNTCGFWKPPIFMVFPRCREAGRFSMRSLGNLKQRRCRRWTQFLA
jgi:hypothetical protein